jgi:hypothetical protein
MIQKGAVGVPIGIIGAPEVIRSVGVVIFHHTLLDEHIPPRPARDSPLRGDEDDAVGRLDAVQSGRGGTLHDLDVLDIVRIEVVDAGCGLAADVVRVSIRSRVDADAIDVVERLVRQRDAVSTADSYLGARPRCPAALEHLDARRSPGQQISELRDRGLFRNPRGIDSRN